MTTSGASRPSSPSGPFFILAAGILWGTTGTAQAFAPPDAPPLAIGAIRLIVAAAALLIFATLRGDLRRRPSWPKSSTFFAAVGVAAYQPFFFSGVAKTGVAVGTIFAIGSAPIFGGVLSMLVHGERPSPRWLLATTLAILGCVLLFAPIGTSLVDPAGILLTLLAGASYAIYAISTKELLAQHTPVAATAVTFGLGALLLFPLALTTDLHWLSQPRGLTIALHLGLVATAAAYLLFSRGLSTIPAANAVTLSLAEPLTAAFLGLVVLGETLTPWATFGVALLFGGLVLLSIGYRQPKIPSFGN